MKTSPIRRILVPLDASPYTDAATSLACDVARKHAARLEGLAVVDTPSIRREVAPADMVMWPAVIDAITHAEAEIRERIHAARAKFAAACEAQGAQHHESEIEGIPATHILDHSSLHDLVVMGMRTYFHYEKHGVGDSLAKVLDRTVTPVLAVPRDPSPALRRVVIAFDGSFASARALRDFVGFAAPFDFEITLFAAHEVQKQAEQLLKHAGECLIAHGMTQYHKQISDDPALDAIYQNGLIDGSDLIVAGIHSRKFMKDAFVGSFVNQLIERGDTALFLSH